MKKLKVNLLNEEIGFLLEDETGRLNFTYLDSWLNSPDAYAISTKLKLQKETFQDAECHAFFSGLLPDDSIRAKIASKLKISEENDFTLLEILGGDCAGAISIEPSYHKKKNLNLESKLVNEKELKAILQALQENPLLTSEGVRLSLAGAQNKIALLKKKNKFYIPGTNEITTHIIKPNVENLKDTVFNEFICMNLAKLCELEVATTEIGFAEDLPYLIIERYDRAKLTNGRLRRIHQEDFCQASRINPEKKYQKEGGPSIKKCAELISEHCNHPGVDKLRLLDTFIFNFLIANNDAHGKNFSLILEPKLIKLAPLYDLLSTEIYPHLNKEMAMKFGKQYLASKISFHDLQQLSEDFSIKPQLIQEKLKAAINTVKNKFPELYRIRELKNHSYLIDKIDQQISRRTALVEKLLP